jgi:hypothetical protein
MRLPNGWKKVGNAGYQNAFLGIELNYVTNAGKPMVEVIDFDGNNTIPFKTKKERHDWAMDFMKRR